MSLNVVFTDTSAGPGSFYFMNFNAEFAGQATDVRSRRHGIAMRASNFFQLRRHGKARENRLRLIGRKRLFFCFSFSVNSGLERKTRALLSGNVFDRSVLRPLGLGRSRPFQR